MRILGVVDTGSIEGKQSKKVLEVYNRLSKGAVFLPPAVGLILDREKRTPEQVKELTELAETSGLNLSFLPRKMYENYLLHPRAIAELINQLDTERSSRVTAEKVKEWFTENSWDRRFIRHIPEKNRNDELWFKEVHGAKLLNNVFNDLTETRVSYDGRKVMYGIELTKWLIKNEPEELNGIGKFLCDVLDAAKRPNDV